MEGGEGGGNSLLALFLFQPSRIFLSYLPAQLFSRELQAVKTVERKKKSLNKKKIDFFLRGGGGSSLKF